MRTTLSAPDAWNRDDGWNDRTALVSGVTTLAILGVAFGAMALGIPYFWVAFPVGFGGVLPLVVAYSARRERTSSASPSPSASGPPIESARDSSALDSPDEALKALRTRYARGELTDEAFETRLERLLETETVAHASNWARDRSAPLDEAGSADERDPEADTRV